MPCVMGCFCSGKGAPGACGGEDDGARVVFFLENPLAHFGPYSSIIFDHPCEPWHGN